MTGTFAQQSQDKIPGWIKNNAGWWADGSIDGASFVQGIEYLIKEDILIIPSTTQGTSSGSDEIPDWIKNNAGWWADGSIDESSFVQGVQFLIEEGVMQISAQQNSVPQNEKNLKTPKKVTPIPSTEQSSVSQNKNNKQTKSTETNIVKKIYELDPPQSQRQKLIDKAQTHGQVRVIVELKIDFKTNLSETQQANQRANIKGAQNSLMNTLSLSDIESTKHFKYTPQIAMTVNTHSLNQLLSSPLVSAVSADKAYTISLDQTLPLIGAPSVFASGWDGTGQTIAILDTGFEKTHEFFSDGGVGNRIVEEACFTTDLPNNEGESLYICPGADSNGDAIGPGTAVPCTGHNDCIHGTHVAGIAAGNSLGMGSPASGVAKGANIIAIQIFTVHQGTHPVNHECKGGTQQNPVICVETFDSDIIAGLQHVYSLRTTYDISSINMSFGAEPYSAPCILSINDDTQQLEPNPLRPSIVLLRNDPTNPIPSIVASGNQAGANVISTPACIPEAISVSAVSESLTVPTYANEADFLDLFAPGGDFSIDNGVTSSIPGNTYSAFQGTSMAAPHVAGAWAVLKQAHPGTSIDDMLDVLKDTGTPIPLFLGGTKPLIQMDAALSALDSPQVFCGRNITEFATVLIGTSGDDILGGTPGDDLINGLGGNDSIRGFGGNDCLIGGDGADILSGGPGNDYLQGNKGDDSLQGDAGNDELFGGLGKDSLSGGDGDDEIHGDENDDSLIGRAGDDDLFGGDGTDICVPGGDAGDTTDSCEFVS